MVKFSKFSKPPTLKLSYVSHASVIDACKNIYIVGSTDFFPINR